ncbi:MAG TPA: hypothetical protein DDZ68_16825 [Parvularcula sp.]|nr:hypothetical protein [Parvularcula sp.]
MTIETLLSKDFAALTRRFEGDSFAARTLERVRRAERLRLIAVGAAGALGGAVAASQFGALATAIKGALPSMASLVIADGAVGIDFGAAPLLAAALLFALVGGATALVAPGSR